MHNVQSFKIPLLFLNCLMGIYVKHAHSVHLGLMIDSLLSVTPFAGSHQQLFMHDMFDATALLSLTKLIIH